MSLRGGERIILKGGDGEPREKEKQEMRRGKKKTRLLGIARDNRIRRKRRDEPRRQGTCEEETNMKRK